MHLYENPYFFLINIIGTPIGDFEWQMKPLARFLSMFFHNATNSICNIIWIGSNGGCAPFYNLIAQS